MGISHKRFGLTAFKAEVAKINKRMHKVPGKVERHKLFRKAFNAGVASRYYRGKKVYMCTECGCEVQWNGQKECPQCHAKWTAKEVYDFPMRNSWGKPKPPRSLTYAYEVRDIAVFEAHHDIQVCRYYRVERTLQFGKPVEYCVWETMRYYYAPNGTRIAYQRPICGLTYYWDSFSRWSELQLRREPKHQSNGALNRSNMDVYTWVIKSLTKGWKYKNLDEVLKKYNGNGSAIRLIAYPYSETLLKCGQEKMFGYMVKMCSRYTDELISILNICIRHHYTIDDPNLWTDNIEYLLKLDMDTHSPKYICPTDLRALHNQLYNRVERHRNAIRAKEKAKEIQKRMARDKKFAEMMTNWGARFGQLLSIDLQGTNLSIRPLQSIHEFEEEGKHMHHCVYQMEYWNYLRHPTSFILSAKDSEGKRLATIEYNMETNTIVQCRAACNQVPERDKEIRQLITDNKAQFVKLERTVKTLAKAA